MDASPLAKLPAELRNNIYHEVLLQEDTIKLSFEPAGNNKKPRVLLSGSRQQHQMLALTFTCKPLRRETQDLFFALNSFEISVPETRAGTGTSSIPIHRFLDGVTTLSARSAIKSVTLNIGQYYLGEKTLLGALTDLKRNLLTTYPCLPLRVRATVAGFYRDESLDIELDTQNLALSIRSGLGKMEELRKGTQDVLKLQLPPMKFERLKDELHACLRQLAGTNKFPALVLP
ncbi:hypothetical protein KC345_g6605 [Hortaea werneckii]|nr:hypothetical protein KC345_g6605 [Hortaea werneckii]